MKRDLRFLGEIIFAAPTFKISEDLLLMIGNFNLDLLHPVLPGIRYFLVADFEVCYQMYFLPLRGGTS